MIDTDGLKKAKVPEPTQKKELPSGRWILTVITGACLLMLVLAYCIYGESRSISADAIAAIITAVFTSYFHKSRIDGNGDSK